MKNNIMRIKTILYILALVFSVQNFTFAQEVLTNEKLLTIEEAVEIALKNNYDIAIASNELKINQENATIGNAGFLPRIDATATNNYNIQNINQTRTDGAVYKEDNAKSNNLQYGVNLGWTIFDGFSMFSQYEQLKAVENLGESQLKLTILNRVTDVMTLYMDMVQEQQQLKAIDSLIVISQQRLTTAKNRFTIGKAAKLEVLNAEVDLNSDITTQLRQLESYKNTRARLNELLSRDIKTNFVVTDIVEVDQNLELLTLLDLASEENPEILNQVISKRIAELELKKVKGNYLPTVAVNTGYNFADSESSLGFTSASSTRGLNYGFSASLNLFDGFAQKRKRQVAQLQIDNAQINIEKQRQNIEASLTTSYETYLTNLQLINLEKKNEAIAKENLDITLVKYKIGTITTLEFRTAQLNYTNAQLRFAQAQYQAKMSEISLKALAGNLSL
ncbi:MAG: TolC family protein [Flavobacterium sp.]